MWYLFDHLEKGSFKTCYADTDSMAIATTRTAEFSDDMTTEQKYRAVFDPIVRPEMRESWEATWKSWFVTTDTIEDGLTPGKLKCKLIFICVQYLIVFRRVSVFKRSIYCTESKVLHCQLSKREIQIGNKRSSTQHRRHNE